MDFVPANVVDLPLLRKARASAVELPYSVRAVSRPAGEFTGDFFFTAQRGDALWFAVGDFAGHGLGAAVFSAMIQEELESQIDACEWSDPAEVVAALDVMLKSELPFNRFATLVVGRAKPDGRVQLVNAGHCYPLLVRANGAREEIGSHGPVVGIAPGASWLQQQFAFGCGDRLFIYTDGIIEASTCEGVELGRNAFVELAAAWRSAEPIEALIDAANEFAGRAAEDDQTVFVLSRLG
jgi:sigma-B regulation protein RsbU (phosphoserine phosphatase)